MPNIEDRRKYLGVDSLVYNSIQDLEDVFRILGKEELCMDCSKGGI
jgi:glutamine phosphoribosylpyrophosphate amidotransferase